MTVILSVDYSDLSPYSTTLRPDSVTKIVFYSRGVRSEFVVGLLRRTRSELQRLKDSQTGKSQEGIG